MMKQYFQSLGAVGSAPPVVGNQLIVGYTVGSPGGACSLGLPVYVMPQYSDIEPGIFVFTDQFLTQPLIGQNYITNQAGTIYLIDSSIGQVGASTGLTC